MSDLDIGCTRFVWEQVVRRARLTGVIPAQGKRGAVTGVSFKAVAFAWASYANPDGTNIFPGIATIAVAAEVSFRTAKVVTAKLVELGLLEKVASGARRSNEPYDVYRLILGPDLYEQVTVLDPAEMKKVAEDMREKYRQPSSERRSAAIGCPLDTTEPVAEWCPADTTPGDAEAADDEARMVSTGPPTGDSMVSAGPAPWCPADRGTNHETEPSVITEPSTGEDLRTEVTVDRPIQDPIEMLSASRPREPPRRPLRGASPCGNSFCRGGVLHIGINQRPCHICPQPEGIDRG